jgi:beta-galactosidase
LRAVHADTRVLGRLKTDRLPGGESGWLTERKRGAGSVVVLGAQPEGESGRKILNKIVAHYAELAGVQEKYEVTPGTLVCPRTDAKGAKSWVVVNMDGAGGNARVGAEVVKLGAYEWCVVVPR